MGRKKDQIWDYVEDLKMGRFKCKFCKNVYYGGATRIKSHLAGVKGHDIVTCDAVPMDVQNEVYEAIQPGVKRFKSAPASVGVYKNKITSTLVSTTQKEKTVAQSKIEDIADVILDDVVDRFDRLIANVFSLAIENIGFEQSFKVELKNLLDTLYKIKFVLHQKRQVSDQSVRIWLMKLRDVAYEVDNVLDELEYEIIQQKVQLQNQMIDQVSSFSSCNHDKVKAIKQDLDKIVNDVAGFGLGMELVKSIIEVRLDKNIYSFLNDSEVVGREFDVVKILNELISCSNQHVISVLPIVGMAGLGKTTLAKVLYNHEEIKKHFDVLAWVHVSENFVVEEILKQIYISLQKGLTASRSEKYFIVLDDVWVEDLYKWDTLRSGLLRICSNAIINIIVTTRSSKVAQILGTLPPHHLEKLSKDDCWSILKKRAFADEGKSLTFDLEATGREIAKRCGGVPLVAKVLGGTMCFKCDKSKWLSIQNNKIWDLLDDVNSIFPVLKLSFDHLPTPSLKQCFVYCAIFPKYYVLEKDQIIEHWMAEGFLEPSKEGNMVMEDIGNMYFNVLLATSFFQNAREDLYGNIISCEMHDLVHDFARSILNSEILILGGDSVDTVSNEKRLFVPSDGKTTPGTSFSGDGFIKLRTSILETFDSDTLLTLRVLKLSGDGIKKLPLSIGQLIHLRLFHIEYTGIKELPNSITKLYKLQTLRIEECPKLMGLPEDLSSLISLRHIYMDKIEVMPKNVGQLTCLQTLPIFCVGPDEGRQIKELGTLEKLRGVINIYNLEYVEDVKEAKSAKLEEKDIFKLGLHWTFCVAAEQLLEGLQPHLNLKSLTISCYGGEKFPSWVGLSLYENLIEINLRLCKECEEVPTLGRLPRLRVLEISKMEKLKLIGSKFYSDGSYSNKLFPALKKLKLECMSNLEEWKDAEGLTTAVLVFPCLEELTIRFCPKLSYAPNSLHTCVSLQKLVVDNCDNFRSLQGVKIMSGGNEELPNMLKSCMALQYLENVDCLGSTSIQYSYLSLQKLKLCGLAAPHSLLHQIQYFIALKILWMERFHEMEALPEWLGNLSSLQQLYLVNCEKLVHLPNEEAMRRLTQLKRLVIYGCPKFDDNELIKIRHVPWVGITAQYPYCKDFEV